MSVLETIRQKSVLLLVVIGGALILFIAGDILTSGQSFFQDNLNEVGEVDGEGITGEEFQRRLQEQEMNYLRRSGAGGIDESTADMLRQQTFDLIVRERIMQEQYDELGLKVTDRELYEMVSGKNPHPSVQQAFTNPETGTFDPAVVARYLQTLDADETGERKREWIAFEIQLRDMRIDEKYKNLVKKGLYVPSFMASHDYIAKNRNATFNYVAQRYSTIPDSTVVVQDSDIQAWYDEHKDDFKQDASRRVGYVVFEVVPSQEDIQATLEDAQELKQEFAVTENDTMFVFDNSEEPTIPTLHTLNDLPAGLDSAFFMSEAGTVHGPYLEEFVVKLSKLSSVRFEPDSVQARHILINIAEGDTAAAQAEIDSLKSIIQSGSDFADLARRHSDDVGSGANGGDLGWFQQGTMVKPFSDAVFNGQVGELPVVTTQFGIHLIEIQGKSAPVRKAEIATVVIPVEAGSETRDRVYRLSNEFLGKASAGPDAFDDAVQEMRLEKSVAESLLESDRTVMGIDNSRQIVRWAYQSEEGSISSFDTGNEYIVTVLEEVRNKGYAEIDQVRPQIELEVIREKKAATIAEKFSNAVSGGSGTLDELSTKTGFPVESASGINFSSYSIQGLGREPALTGKVFGLKPSVLSTPVKGETGVYMVVVQNFSEITLPEDLTENRSQLASLLGNRVDFEVYEALKEKAGVEDNLGRFY